MAGELDPTGKPNFLGVTVQAMISLEGYELIIGSSIDPQFGPVLLFGLGGQLVEVFKDSALGLPPLNSTLVRRMMERTKIYKALKGVRGRKSVDLDELERLIVRFSTLISEHRWIKELDINPLLASPDRLLALDARIVVYGKDVQENELPRLAIRPYPNRYVTRWTAKDGSEWIIRPVRAEDEPALVDFHELLSDRSVYLRFLSPLRLSDRAKHDRLSRICHGDYANEIALIVENPNPEKNQLSVIAASRLTRLHGANAARFSMLISDCCQGMGIGKELMSQMIRIARLEHYQRLECLMTPDNQPMTKILQKYGFTISDNGDGFIRADLALR